MWAIESDTEQILKSVLAGAPSVPARRTVIGQSEVEWWEGKCGVDVISTIAPPEALSGAYCIQ